MWFLCVQPLSELQGGDAPFRNTTGDAPFRNTPQAKYGLACFVSYNSLSELQDGDAPFRNTTGDAPFRNTPQAKYGLACFVAYNSLSELLTTLSKRFASSPPIPWTQLKLISGLACMHVLSFRAIF